MRTTLNQLAPGETGIVAKVRGGGSIQRRIIDMGVVAGTSIEMLKFAPLGDPVEVRVKGFNLSLRKAEAEFIELDIPAKE
jgi:Fe2+ transport system protein FeoA